MRQHWSDISFLHWPVEPDLVDRVIPAGLEPDTHDGSAWVGLVPFRMVAIRPPVGPAIPYLGTFPETNVRTYVVGPKGPGVWFHSLDASRLLPVAIARIGYRLPYFYSSMRVEVDDRAARYNTIRRWPGPRGTGGSVTVDIGPIVAPSDLDTFLTARWRLYTSQRGKLYSAEVRHPEWPLRSAVASSWDDELIRSAGYPPARSEPRTLFSRGVPVEVYPPERVG